MHLNIDNPPHRRCHFDKLALRRNFTSPPRWHRNNIRCNVNFKTPKFCTFFLRRTYVNYIFQCKNGTLRKDYFLKINKTEGKANKKKTQRKEREKKNLSKFHIHVYSARVFAKLRRQNTRLKICSLQFYYTTMFCSMTVCQTIPKKSNPFFIHQDLFIFANFFFSNDKFCQAA